jgi:hypothetical protein
MTDDNRGYVCKALPVCLCAANETEPMDPFTCTCEVMGNHGPDDERMCCYCGAELVLIDYDTGAEIARKQGETK